MRPVFDILYKEFAMKLASRFGRVNQIRRDAH